MTHRVPKLPPPRFGGQENTFLNEDTPAPVRCKREVAIENWEQHFGTAFPIAASVRSRKPLENVESISESRTSPRRWHGDGLAAGQAFGVIVHGSLSFYILLAPGTSSLSSRVQALQASPHLFQHTIHRGTMFGRVSINIKACVDPITKTPQDLTFEC